MEIKRDVFLFKSIEHGYENLTDTDYTRSGHDEDYLLLGKGTATIILIEQDERVAAAEQLEKKKIKVLGRHALEIEKIDERIQQLRALTHDTEKDDNE